MEQEVIEIFKEVIKKRTFEKETYYFVLEYDKKKDMYKPKIVMGDDSIYSEGIWEKRGTSLGAFWLEQASDSIKDKLDIISDKGKLNVKIEKIIREFCSKEEKITNEELQKNTNLDTEIPIDNNTDTNDTNITNDTNDTNDTNQFIPCVSFVMCNTEFFSTLFSDSTLDLILKELALAKKPLTFGELSERIGKKEVVIRNTISRNKGYFGKKKPDGKICYTFLLQMAVDEIQSRIDKFEAEKDKKRLLFEKVNAQKEIRKSYENKVTNFIHNSKPKREGNKIFLDFEQLLEYNYHLADYFLDNANEFLSIIKGYFEGMEIKIFNLPKSHSLNIEQLRKEHENKIICIDGRITSFSQVRPIINQINYECPSCGTIIKEYQNYVLDTITEPTKCSCGRKGFFFEKEVFKLNTSFIQLEDLQEKTDNPHSSRIKGILFDGLCDSEEIKKFCPGNEIRVVGILKEVPKFKGKKKLNKNDWIFEVLSGELIEEDINIDNFTDEEVEEIAKLSSSINQNGITTLLESFAPDVFGYDEIKSALILQGCNRKNDKLKNQRKNKSNILLIGDPGIAKSVLCDFAVSVTTGAKKAVGGGSSAVGITASVIKEEESMGGYRIEPGAMILAKELLLIDELNNLNDEEKPKLQEGMESQTISIDKANLHMKMKVTAGILATANPKSGHWVDESKMTLEEQFNLPTPILNRFDTIFVLKDEVNESIDKKIAERMIHRHSGKIKCYYDVLFLKKFFSYIRSFPEPKINDECEKLLTEIYHKARQTFNQGVKINPRFLESVTRMAIASAKLRQSEFVEFKDLKLVINILSKSQYKIDADKILSLVEEIK